MSAVQTMKLPEGKTCADCAHFKRCVALFQCPSDNEECDWAPSRFRDVSPAATLNDPASTCARCVERNELRELASILITNAEMIPDPRREGATDCYAVTLDDLEALEAALGPQTKDTK